MISGVTTIAGHARDEDLADRLIEDQLDGHAGVGTGEDGSERFLLLGCSVLEYLQILLDGRQLIRREPLVSGNELLGRGIRSQIRLRPERRRRSDFERGGSGCARGCAREHRSKDLAPAWHDDFRI